MNVRQTESGAAPITGAAGHRFAIVVSRFNDAITGRLRDGAHAALVEGGAVPADIDVFAVPGAFELPQAARSAAETGRFDAIVCLGCVIRGETPHFDFVAGAAARGLQRLAIEGNVALSFGVLTTDTLDQARERADRARGDKGGEAARAALLQAALYERLREGAKPTVRGFRIS